jgi:hypothetical protein
MMAAFLTKRGLDNVEIYPQGSCIVQARLSCRQFLTFEASSDYCLFWKQVPFPACQSSVAQTQARVF